MNVGQGNVGPRGLGLAWVRSPLTDVRRKAGSSKPRPTAGSRQAFKVSEEHKGDTRGYTWTNNEHPILAFGSLTVNKDVLG